MIVTECPMLNSAIDRPRPLSAEIFQVGSKSIHVSHKLNIFKGLMYCRRCGCRASTKGASFIKKLSHPCMPPGAHGLENLKRLSQGKLPRRVTQWPLHCLDDADGDVESRVAATPLSDFDKQVILDHPELSVAECKIVASMLLKCAEFVNRLGSRLPAGPASVSAASA